MMSDLELAQLAKRYGFWDSLPETSRLKADRIVMEHQQKEEQAATEIPRKIVKKKAAKKRTKKVRSNS